jgi:hypothetical protein
MTTSRNIGRAASRSVFPREQRLAKAVHLATYQNTREQLIVDYRESLLAPLIDLAHKLALRGKDGAELMAAIARARGERL